MAFRESYPLDHATHVPVLIGLGSVYPNIRRVLEFGSGNNSTLLFLNRLIFPSVERLVSIETDPAWFDMMKETTKTNGYRVSLVKEFSGDLGGFDLVFIDNHPWQTKQETILKVAKTFQGMIVVHDSEEPLYENVLSEIPNRVNFSTFNPETTVGGGPAGQRSNQVALKQIARQIEDFSDLDPSDVYSWSNVFRRRL